MTDPTDTIHVLHVDDEPDFARLTARHLERETERLVVYTATTAEEVFEQLDGDIDCVVSDYWMPDTDGLELFRAVRERYPDLPFILFTDTGSEEVASEAISAGVTDYLIKGVVAEQSSLLAKNVVTAVEKRRAEQRASETERLLHELADQTDDVLWTFSADWSELQFINDAYEAVFEQPIERIRDQPAAFLEAIHPQDRDRVELAMERVSNGIPVRIEYRIETPDAAEKWVESRAKAVTEEGSAVRIVGFTRDITDRKHWEQELERKNDQLERFASTVAHDLRNPHGVASGFLDLAREEHDSDDLRTVSNALDRMDRIVTDLLELARAGATIDERKPIDIDEFLQTCFESVPHGTATLRIETDLTVSADPGRLAQAFENLFRNSVEHGSTGSRSETGDSVEHGSTGSRPEADDAIEHGGEDVTIRVGTLRTDPGAGIYVEDDGPGIDPIDRDSVFESGHTTTEEGTGFGLAIVREVIEAHGWDVEATAADDGGARFEITGIEPITG